MSVGQVCRRPACTATRALTLRAAAERMRSERVGSLVVVDDQQRPVGFLTDRDVALGVLAGGLDAEAPAGDFCGLPPVTVEEALPLREASPRMRERGMRRLPVVDGEGRAVGMLAADDLVPLLAQEVGALADVAAEQSPPQAPPSGEDAAARTAGHYRKEVASVSSETPVAAVASRMRADAIGCVVVVDEAGAPTGMITDRDLAVRVVAEGRDPAATPASAVMSASVTCVDARDRIQHVASEMSRNGVRRIPVLRDGQLHGLVSYDDLLVALGRELHDLGEAARGGIRREQLLSRAEERRHEVENAVHEVGAVLDRLGQEARDAVVGRLEALRQRLGRHSGEG
ncbi:MAG: CBS domain-containing protein [Myxococcota bacterium]|nr:CBS domain-containing protein [Myxococcota bacterium]